MGYWRRRLLLFATVWPLFVFLFRTSWLIDKLQLDEGFAQNAVALAVHRSTILSVSVVVIGGWLVASELPNLGRQLLTYSQERRDGHLNPDLTYLMLTAFKIAVGMLLVSKQRQLVSLIEYQRQH